MVDFFLVLMLAGAGDELQGIKKGILEIADALAINKADGENVAMAQQAASQYIAALNLFRHDQPDVGSTGRDAERAREARHGHDLGHHPGPPRQAQRDGRARCQAPRAAARLVLERRRGGHQGALPRPSRRPRAELESSKPRSHAGATSPTAAARRVLALAGA